jgi:hypothetical protein
VDDGLRDTSKKALILHTAVTTATDLPFPDSSRPGVGVHFYLLKDGSLHQYLDTDRQTGHAWDANSWAIGMESQDSGSSADPGLWTPNQLDTIDRLCRTLGIPAQALKEGPSSGVGYHRQFDSWNQSHHSCPGDAKVAQVAGIIARLKGDDDVITKDAGNALSFIYGMNERWKKNARPTSATKPDMGDGADHTGAAQNGWDYADGKKAP